jgi:hypothetical protein
LFSKLNPRIKRVWFIDNVKENAICSTEFVPYKAKNNELTYYVNGLINSDLFYNQALSIVNGATGNRIGAFNANQSGNIEVTIPAATAESAGLAKLYNAASDANDGALTAKAVTSQLSSKLDASKYGYIPTNSNGTGEALIWVE